MENKKTHRSKIGGQALIEGIMMRGITNASMAVRTPSNEIYLETWDIKTSKMDFLKKIPVIRGIFQLIDSLIMGYKCLNKSSEKAFEGEDEETPSKFEKWLSDKFGEKLMNFLAIISTIVGVLVAVGLFMFLPTIIVGYIDGFVELGYIKSILEGLIKIILFVTYLYFVSKIDTIYRTFQYHGAEHKTIFCYENGLELTVENVKRQSRLHPRCGTSFLFIVLVLSILVFSIVSWESVLIRNILKIILLPLVIGLAYEIIKIAGRYDNWFTKIISYPGMMIQKITTKEPDDSQIEVAIAAMEVVIPENKEEDKW